MTTTRFLPTLRQTQGDMLREPQHDNDNPSIPLTKGKPSYLGFRGS